MGSRGRPCLTAICSSPPIPISRRAAGNGRERSVAVQRGAVEELEELISGPEEVVRRERWKRRWDAGGTTACRVERVHVRGGFGRMRIMEG